MLKYLHSFVAIPLIYLYTIVMGSISLILSLHDPTGERQHACSRIWCRMIAATVGVKVRVHGMHHINPGRPMILLSNHQSYMDIPVLFAFLPVQFKIFAKKPLFYVPFMGWHLWRSGQIAVDRSNKAAASTVIRKGIEKLATGVSILIFPEGTRSRVPRQLKQFKAGAFKIAYSAKSPIVPITIIGTAEALPPDSLIFRPRTVDMYIDPPIAVPEGDERECVDWLMEETRRCMTAHLAETTKRPTHDRSADRRPVSLLR